MNSNVIFLFCGQNTMKHWQLFVSTHGGDFSLDVFAFLNESALTCDQHVTRFIAQVSIGNPEKMEPITNVSQIPSNRWALICCLCKEKTGACIQVESALAFHPRCSETQRKHKDAKWDVKSKAWRGVFPLLFTAKQTWGMKLKHSSAAQNLKRYIWIMF